MLQLMASNHPGPTTPYGASYGLQVVPPARIFGSGRISTHAFLGGSSQAPSLPKSARPHASGLGFDPGRNVWVESRVWGMGSSSFPLCPRPASPRQKILGRAEICHGSILPGPQVGSQGFPLGVLGPQYGLPMCCEDSQRDSLGIPWGFPGVP